MAELLNLQVNPSRPGPTAAASERRPHRHAKSELPQRQLGAISPPIKRFYVQDNPALLARVLL